MVLGLGPRQHYSNCHCVWLLRLTRISVGIWNFVFQKDLVTSEFPLQAPE